MTAGKDVVAGIAVVFVVDIVVVFIVVDVVIVALLVVSNHIILGC